MKFKTSMELESCDLIFFIYLISVCILIYIIIHNFNLLLGITGVIETFQSKKKSKKNKPKKHKSIVEPNIDESTEAKVNNILVLDIERDYVSIINNDLLELIFRTSDIQVDEINKAKNIDLENKEKLKSGVTQLREDWILLLENIYLSIRKQIPSLDFCKTDSINRTQDKLNTIYNEKVIPWKEDRFNVYKSLREIINTEIREHSSLSAYDEIYIENFIDEIELLNDISLTKISLACETLRKPRK